MATDTNERVALLRDERFWKIAFQAHCFGHSGRAAISVHQQYEHKLAEGRGRTIV